MTERKNSGENRKRSRPGPGQNPELVQAAIVLAQMDMPAAQAWALLKKDPRFCNDLPSVRALQDWMDPYRPGDPSGPWALTWQTAPQAAAVLPVLAEVVVRTEGRTTVVTNAVARWLAALEEAAPDLDPWMRYRQALLYAGYDAEPRARPSEGRVACDAFLAFAPWRSTAHATRYLDAVERRWVPAHPAFHFGRGTGGARSRGEGTGTVVPSGSQGM